MNGLYDLLPGRADFDESKHRLGRLCKRGHNWMGTGQSLQRINGGRCLECEKQRKATPEVQAYTQEWRKQNLEDQRRKARERMAKLRQDPEYAEICRERNRSCMAKSRAANGRTRMGLHFPPHLLGHGFRTSDLQAFIAAGWDLSQLDPAMVVESREEWRQMRQALQGLNPPPSVARLVMDEQQRHWRENPDAEKEHKRQWGQAKWWLEYQTRPELRLYNRQKSRRRKARMRESVAIQVTGKQIRGRFAEFDHHCAYCGAAGDLHIEHVVPISKGGPHAIGNIIPACKDCNFSKRDHDAETWYRRQPFFTEARWRKICRTLGWGNSSIGQLALL
jgi:5-methylcytosine-specific restriction endonuclease McrA